MLIKISLLFTFVCNKNFCKGCINSHDNLIDNHSLISINDYNPNKINYICEYHSKPFVFYCNTCNHHLCENCNINDHSKCGHDLKNLKELYSKIDKKNLLNIISNYNNFMNVDLLEYKNKLIQLLQDLINSINSAYNNYINDNNNLLNLINIYIENFKEKYIRIFIFI